MAYTKEQLFAKLQKADAAGDTEAAKVIAAEIRKLSSDVEVPSVEPVAQEPPSNGALPADGSLLGANFSAAMGSTVGDTANGLMQSAIEGGPAGKQARSLVEMTGLNLPENPLQTWIEKRIADKRELDAPLLESEGGTRGSMAGNLAQLATPGATAKLAALKIPSLTGVGAAMAPTSYAGNAAMGGVMGAIQPRVAGESQGTNVALGAGLGVLGRGAGDVVRSPFVAGRYLKDLLSKGGAESRVASDLVEMGVSKTPSIRQAPLPEFDLNSAQATGDPIIAALTRARRGRPEFMKELTERLGINQKKANEIVDGLAGSPEDVVNAKAARAKATGPLYKKAEAAKKVDVSSVINAAKRGEKRLNMAPSSQANMREVIGLLEKAKKDGGKGLDLNVLRQTLGDLVSGKGQNASFAQKTADRNILPIKTRLEESFGKQVPEFKQAQNKFKELSGPVNQLQVIQAIAGRSKDTMANVTLGGLDRALRADKALVKSQTGMKNKTLSDILTPDQNQKLTGVRDYLRMNNEAERIGGGINSQTNQSQSLLKNMSEKQASIWLNKVPLLKIVGEGLDARAKQVYENALDKALQNPQGLVDVLNKLPPKDRAKAMQVLQSIPNEGGRAGAASVSDNRRRVSN